MNISPNQHTTSTQNQKNIVLAVAPMEGVMDHTMRALLSKIGGMDYFVSEFVRVTQQPIPASSFTRLVPELQNQGQTEYKHPVHTQLLGNNAELMAKSALNAVLAGATHIDVNFGCPAKRVNGHGGGSVLLETPQTLHDIMSSIRKKLPAHIPVSAKIRLGFNDEALLFDNVAAIEAAGTNILTIHGRTKKDGYKPPARWGKIGSIQDKTGMTVIANGDIIDVNTLLRCQSITGCRHFMIGRGALYNPFTFHQIRKQLNGEVSTLDITAFVELFADYALALQNIYDDISALGRLKQWCGHLKFEFNPVNHHLYDLRRSQTVTELVNKFREIMTEKPL